MWNPCSRAYAGIKIAAVVFITLYGPLVSGFLIPKDDLPTPVQYLHYASPFSITFETLMISEFSGVGVSKEVRGLDKGMCVGFGYSVGNIHWWRSRFHDMQIEAPWHVIFTSLMGILEVECWVCKQMWSGVIDGWLPSSSNECFGQYICVYQP